MLKINKNGQEITLQIKPQRRHYTEVEAQSVALWLQQTLLVELCGLNKWAIGEIAFHGGTSLKLARGSVRFSEDIDLMIDDSRKISTLIKKLEKRMNFVLKAHFGDESLIRFKARGEDKNPLMYTFTMERAERLDHIKVKMEFFVTPEVKGYDSEVVVAQPLSQNIEKFELRAEPFAFPVATINQIVWDKLFALMHRPYLKFRDIFDLAWLHEQLGGFDDYDPGDVQKIVENLDAIYKQKTDPKEWSRALEKIHSDLTDQRTVNAYAEDMSRWLPSSRLHPAVIDYQVGAAKKSLEHGMRWIQRAFPDATDIPFAEFCR